MRDIIRDNWEWRAQIWRLAITELQKQIRGAVLGWLWLVATPCVYIGVFWFALQVGLRTASPVHGTPYVIWIAIGIIPWFFMSDMISSGCNVYRRYSYLVNRLRFPIAVISSFYAAAQFVIFLLSMVVVLIAMVLMGVSIKIYAVQILPLSLVMYLFWTTWSMLTSPLSALSKDFYNLLKALSTPIFWLSGVIFDFSNIHSTWLQWFMAFNPVTFFVTSYRAALCDHYWVWDKPRMVFPFFATFLLMGLLTGYVQRRLKTEISDVL